MGSVYARELMSATSSLAALDPAARHEVARLVAHHATLSIPVARVRDQLAQLLAV